MKTTKISKPSSSDFFIISNNLVSIVSIWKKLIQPNTPTFLLPDSKYIYMYLSGVTILILLHRVSWGFTCCLSNFLDSKFSVDDWKWRVACRMLANWHPTTFTFPYFWCIASELGGTQRAVTEWYVKVWRYDSVCRAKNTILYDTQICWD